MVYKQAVKIPHGFSLANIVIIVILILILWGIRIASKDVPQIRDTANKVVSLNNLENVNLKIGGCVPIKGNL